MEAGMDPQETAAAAFSVEGLEPIVWSNGPGAEYAAHQHSQPKVLFCVEGSIVFHTGDEDSPLEPGDRIDLPAGTVHTATVGPNGVTCWEAFRTSAGEPATD